ncbi:MAG: altronate dehydratase family protein [Bryobacterales bacterium]|nr:altronate dehydratase family protein [Bryobacterales bacterium]
MSSNLLNIQPLATPTNAVIRLNVRDNVAIARVNLPAGQRILLGESEVIAVAQIPAGHKVAIAAIPAGNVVRRYAEIIGRAKRDIVPGEHVHTHNVGYEEFEMAYEFPRVEVPYPPLAEPAPTVQAYLRSDGRAGTRNYVAIVSASNCAAHTADLIAASFGPGDLPPNVDGVVAFTHGEGCGHTIGPDTEQLHRIVAGVLNHPNVAGAVLLGLGCEVNQIDAYLPPGTLRTEHITATTLQDSGGTRGTVQAGVAAVKEHFARIREMRRQTVPASKVILGLNCGGSDSFSGITANPALGYASDLLAAIGASAVLAETPEIFGAEHLLVRRARNRATAEKLLSCIRDYKTYLNRFTGSFDDNPSPGNKEGGLTTILEKSLGAVAKSGTSPLMQVVEYAEQITSPGLVFMNTPGYDPVSLTGLTAGGVNLIAFTTGRGSAIGNPVVPVIKIATNTPMYERMTDNMDLNAGRIMDGEATIEQVGEEIFRFILEVAGGRKTKAEQFGHREFVPWRIGPVL